MQNRIIGKQDRGGEKMFEVEKVDRVIEKICERVMDDLQEETGETLAEEIKALAELISIRAKYC